MAKASNKYLIKNLNRILNNVSKELSRYEKLDTKAANFNKEVLAAKAMVEFHDVAEEFNCINPELLYKALETDLKIEDFAGIVEITPIEKETGKPAINPRTGRPYNVSEFINKASQREDLSFLFKEDNLNENDTKLPSASKRKNPWKKESFNLTKQGEITRENPELAARLKAEAGA